MDSEKITEIWRQNAVREIETYSDAQITSIVLKSARKAINHSYPGVIFWTLLMLVNLLIVGAMMKYAPARLLLYGYVLTAAVTLLLAIAICLSEWGRRRAQSYSFDMSLKEWVESRIADFDKGMERIKRNWFWRYGAGLTVLMLFCLIYVLTVGFSLRVLLVQLAAGITALIIAGAIGNRVSLKRMAATRSRLQELYDQLQEPE